MIITTSRKPCRRTRSLCKDLERALPGALYITRGKKSMDEILRDEKIILVSDRKGNPGKMELYENKNLVASFLIKGIKLKREIKKKINGGNGEIASVLSAFLKSKIKQRGDWLLFDNGPEIKILSWRRNIGN
jgi:rRNA maturation protein Rpf1